MDIFFFRFSTEKINSLLKDSIDQSGCLNYHELCGLLLDVEITLYIIPGVIFSKFEDTSETHIVYLKNCIP